MKNNEFYWYIYSNFVVDIPSLSCCRSPATRMQRNTKSVLLNLTSTILYIPSKYILKTVFFIKTDPFVIQRFSVIEKCLVLLLLELEQRFSYFFVHGALMFLKKITELPKFRNFYLRQQ